MARAALKLTVRDLADLTGYAAMTITRFENGSSKGSPELLQAIAEALESRGTVFVPGDEDAGPGVRLSHKFAKEVAMLAGEYNQETAEGIIDWMDEGVSLTEIGKMPEMPGRTIINRWRRESKWFRDEVYRIKNTGPRNQ